MVGSHSGCVSEVKGSGTGDDLGISQSVMEITVDEEIERAG